MGQKNKKKCKINSRNFTYDGLTFFCSEHPHCRDQHHKDNDKFLQIIIESMTGKDDPNIIQEYDKIIRNVAKEVFIDKS